MAAPPLSLRLDPQLRSILSEGRRRTALNTAELVRRTLRRHLREVIEQEAAVGQPLTNVSPWPNSELRKAYRKIGRGWDRVELEAARAQKPPSFED